MRPRTLFCRMCGSTTLAVPVVTGVVRTKLVWVKNCKRCDVLRCRKCGLRVKGDRCSKNHVVK